MAQSAVAVRPTVWTSTVGVKAVMAVAGVGLVTYAVLHMLGNLQVLVGRDAFNAYAHALKSTPALLWTARILPGAALAVHVAGALYLARRNRLARPERYRAPSVPSLAPARVMLLTGSVVLAFIVLHLAHFTFGWTHPQDFHRVDALGRHDAYAMVVLGFSRPLLALFYAVAQTAVAFHLWHAVTSVWRTLGLVMPRHDRLVRWCGPAVAGVVLLGNLAIVGAIQLGMLPL